jgi:hypothetical protein
MTNDHLSEILLFGAILFPDFGQARLGGLTEDPETIILRHVNYDLRKINSPAETVILLCRRVNLRVTGRAFPSSVHKTRATVGSTAVFLSFNR